MKVTNIRVHSPSQEIHEKTMKLLSEGCAQGTHMSTVTNQRCDDPDCREIHSEVKVEVPEPMFCT